IERLQERGRRGRLRWAQATAWRSLALLSAARGDLDTALHHITVAARQQRQLEMPFDLARTLLVEGRIRRRRKEKRAARVCLDQPDEAFVGLGALAWAQKARNEVDRLGLRTSSATELTTTERSIAELAASGLSNSEIADRLFVSRKTVEFNLGN